MAQNYATKYASKVDEAFTLGSLTDAAVNQEFDWEGVSTVVVYGGETSKLNDYKMEGTNRYGEPEELGDTKQEMSLSQDKSFTFTIDRKNYDDTMMTKEAGKCLRRELDQVIIPAVDMYRFGVWGAKAAKKEYASSLTKTNAYEAFLNLNGALDDAKVPAVGRIAFCKPAFYNLLKQDPAFTKNSDLGQEMLIKGQLGDVDGVAIVKAPSSYFPNDSKGQGAELIIVHPLATTAPKKLLDYKIHDNPPGINGWLVEGRIRHDAFILNKKKGAVAVLFKGTAPTETTGTTEG